MRLTCQVSWCWLRIGVSLSRLRVLYAVLFFFSCPGRLADYEGQLLCALWGDRCVYFTCWCPRFSVDEGAKERVLSLHLE